jgi:hypothetical protein
LFISFKVQDIPPDIKDAKVIVNHFKKFGEVHSVLLCYDVRNLAETQIQIDDAVMQVQKKFFFFFCSIFHLLFL